LLAYGVIFLLAIVVFQLIVTVTSYIRPLPETISDLKPFLNLTTKDGNTSILTLIKSNNDAIASLNRGIVDIVKTIITLLGGALSAIIGFYFGNKAATDVRYSQTGSTPSTSTP
jgi:hypothetical protein